MAYPNLASSLFIVGITGASAGLVSLIFEHPFDALKTLWQSNPHFRSLREVFLNIFGRFGFRGFYAGAIPNFIRVFLKNFYRFPLMVGLPLLITPLFGKGILGNLATGLIIAFFEVFIITPLERLKVWFMTSPIKKGVFQYFFGVFKGKTVTSLYQGFSITLIRQITAWVVFLILHNGLMDFAKETLQTPILPLKSLIILGLIEGLITCLFVQPLDYLKTNLQKYNAPEQNIATATQYHYKKSGIKVFYVGWTPRLIQYLINASITVPILESLKIFIQHVK